MPRRSLPHAEVDPLGLHGLVLPGRPGSDGVVLHDDAGRLPKVFMVPLTGVRGPAYSQQVLPEPRLFADAILESIMANEQELVDILTKRLTQLKAGDETLQQVIDAAKAIHGKGTVTRVFPKGIVLPDGYSLEAELSADQLSLVGDLLKGDGIRGVEVFPIGLIATDRFRAIVNIG